MYPHDEKRPLWRSVLTSVCLIFVFTNISPHNMVLIKKIDVTPMNELIVCYG